MPIYTLPVNITNSSTGLEGLIIYESSQVPILAPSLLLFLFTVIMGAGYYSQERKTGRGNFQQWAAIASLITFTCATVLFLYRGIISLEILVIAAALMVGCILWYFTSPDDF